MARNVLIVEDEASERDALARLVGHWGYEVETAASAEEALATSERWAPAVVITDLVLPEMDGVGLLQRFNETGRTPMVLVLTGHGSVESAVDAMRRGAYDYLTKPVDAVRLRLLLEKAAERASLSREVALLRHQLRQKGAFGDLLGEAKGMQEVYRWIELAAPSSAPVLIYGESGTGKELVARTIHERSERRAHALVAINCAAIPETLIESELFGHERGAFTGATERRSGCFELSDHGTLFLDEIAEMDVSVQAKLLRVLAEGSFRRVGGKTELKVDVRIVAATNQVPTEALEKGKFREDLYYRLNVFPIPVPALRERLEDIPLLVRHFIDEFNREDRRAVRDLTAEAIRALNEYAWPGNVRQLRNVIQRAVIACEGSVIGIEHLPPELHSAAGGGGPASAPAARTASSAAAGAVKLPAISLKAMERALIQQVLEDTNFDRDRAASILGVSGQALRTKLAKLGIKP
ncbi:MAG TPA: sigma-54 dependent transcriptional regulator [Methylomirabilota bacterium]|nr:sigma-54 dependent transcriptional regulator [Methylomirabilota bacterium]